MNNPQTENLTEPQPPTPNPQPQTLYYVLQAVAMVALVVGFAGPWIYGPIGKGKDWGWQPIATLITLFIPANIVVVGAVINCFSYLELRIRLGQPVLAGLLKWIGVFLLMALVIPVALWLSFDFTGRSPTPQTADYTIGWGAWLALFGWLVQVIALRWRIYQLKRQ